ncbi:hypothetical protein AN642_00910 [Epulopiscium sp. SCG-B10WGA-EpuloA2]|nr:hypothetical protein AN642_00910 [Epulopiscium sp. SCG-B10WGA-EpuloA2]
MKKKDRELISFDYAMKYMLREKANFDILEGFLIALLNEEVEIIEILESESNIDDNTLKLNRVDLLIKDSKNRRMIIEIQYAAEMDYLARILWESCKTIVDSLPRGADYGDIVKVISISLLYFNIGVGCVYKGTTEFYDIKTKEKLFTEINKNNKTTNKQKVYKDIYPDYYLININKFNDIVETDLDEWIYMFKNSTVVENFKAKYMDKAQAKLSILKMTAKEKQQYEAHEKEKKIMMSVLKTTEAEGIAKGRAQGLAEGRAEGEEKGRIDTLIRIIQNLKAQGADIEIIKTVTQLTENEIQKLITTEDKN